MAARRESAPSTRRTIKAVARSTGTVPRERYPEWKVELFRAGIAERRQSAAGQISGRATRAPGA